MDLLLAFLLFAAWLAVPLGFALPARRPLAVLIALAVTAFALGAGWLGEPVRNLDVTHTFVAYQQRGFDREAHDFVVDRVTAAGWQWPLPFALWASLWSAVLWRLGRRPVGGFLLPLLCAWSAAAAWLAMQKLAAPAATVQPFGIERFLWPCGLAGALLIASRGERLLPVLLRLAVLVGVLRLPLALFAKLASDGHWGTGLDIHTITVFLNPLQPELEVETTAGSAEQQGWLIWAQHLLFLPAFYLMSLLGIAVMAFLFRQHLAAARREFPATAGPR